VTSLRILNLKWSLLFGSIARHTTEKEDPDADSPEIIRADHPDTQNLPPLDHGIQHNEKESHLDNQSYSGNGRSSRGGRDKYHSFVNQPGISSQQHGSNKSIGNLLSPVLLAILQEPGACHPTRCLSRLQMCWTKQLRQKPPKAWSS